MQTGFGGVRGGEGMSGPFPAHRAAIPADAPTPARRAARARRAAATGDRAAPWSFKLLLLFLVALYSNVALWFPAVAPYAPAQSVAIAALLALAAERTIARRPLALVWPFSHLLLAFLGVAAISSFTALWPRHAVENTVLVFKFVAIYLLIVNTVESWRRLRLVVGATALAGIFPAAGALNNVRTGDLAEGGRTGWIGIFANPNDLAYALAMLVPLVVGLALGSSRLGWRLALWGLAGVYAAATFFTYSRSGLLALGAVVVLCFLRWNRSWLKVPAAVLAGVAMAAAVGTYWAREQGFSDILTDVTLQQRVQTVRVGLAMFADHPLLGVGPGCSVVGWPLYAPPGTATGAYLHTHNTFIQVLGETGLLGTIPFVVLVGLGLLAARRLAGRWLRAGRPDRARLIAGLEIALWGFLISSLAAGLLLTWYPYLLLGYVSVARRITATTSEGARGAG